MRFEQGRRLVSEPGGTSRRHAKYKLVIGNPHPPTRWCSPPNNPPSWCLSKLKTASPRLHISSNEVRDHARHRGVETRDVEAKRVVWIGDGDLRCRRGNNDAPRRDTRAFAVSPQII